MTFHDLSRRWFCDEIRVGQLAHARRQLCVRSCVSVWLSLRAFVCALVRVCVCVCVCLCQCLRARACLRECVHALPFRPSQASLPISALVPVSAPTPVLRLCLCCVRVHCAVHVPISELVQAQGRHMHGTDHRTSCRLKFARQQRNSLLPVAQVCLQFGGSVLIEGKTRSL